MTDHRRPAKLATATMVDLIGKGQALQAAVIRGAAEEEVERLRHEALAAAEAYLDRTVEAATAIRQMIEGLPDADRLGEEGARRLLE